MSTATVQGSDPQCRYFVSYSGVRLPLNLIGAIEPEALSNRNTFIRASYDTQGQLMGFEKLVYGEVELSHLYRYHGNGSLASAEIAVPDEETVLLQFDESGALR